VTWRAVSDSDWIKITAGQTGTGLSAVFFTVTANTSSNARTGHLVIAGRPVTISQPGRVPPFTVSGRVMSDSGMPISGVTLRFSRIAGGGEVPFSVQTDSDGNWTQTDFEPGTTYQVTASKIRTTFSPNSHEFEAATTTLNFVTVGRRISN
jgi:hypothetical protein